jgi:hypothetical protein
VGCRSSQYSMLDLKVSHGWRKFPLGCSESMVRASPKH